MKTETAETTSAAIVAPVVVEFPRAPLRNSARNWLACRRRRAAWQLAQWTGGAVVAPVTPRSYRRALRALELVRACGAAAYRVTVAENSPEFFDDDGRERSRLAARRAYFVALSSAAAAALEPFGARLAWYSDFPKVERADGRGLPIDPEHDDPRD